MAASELIREPCRSISAVGVICGTFGVPENWMQPSGRLIRIHVAVAPATGPDPLADPVFFFYGGPGAAASDDADRDIERWRALRARHDLVFVDQRGTGRSAALHCAFAGDPDDPNTYAIDLFDRDHLAACRDRLALRADLTRYGTAHATRDVEAVRAALGYRVINIVGHSYGTRAAQEYLRRHPMRVRTVVLLGAVPPSASITEGMAAALDATLLQLFDSCESDRACHEAYPRLREDATAVFGRARAQGFTAHVAIDRGVARDVTVSHDLAVAWLRSRLYSVTEAARLPRVLTLAARGDARELVGGAIRWRRGIARALAEGMYASVACNEDMPFVDVPHEVAAAQGTLLGAHRVTSQQAACKLWPRAVVASDIKTPVVAAAPVLVINGDRDPATGLDWARMVVAHAPDGRLVVARHRSHALAYRWASCLGPIAERFIETADAAAVNDGCAAELSLPPFETGAAATAESPPVP